jgi:hypothetical protein
MGRDLARPLEQRDQAVLTLQLAAAGADRRGLAGRELRALDSAGQRRGRAGWANAGELLYVAAAGRDGHRVNDCVPGASAVDLDLVAQANVPKPGRWDAGREQTIDRAHLAGR